MKVCKACAKFMYSQNVGHHSISIWNGRSEVQQLNDPGMEPKEK